jgi:hypothetical protein
VTDAMPKWSWPFVFIAAFWLGLWLLKAAASAGSVAIGRLLLPLEVRVLMWLQDRATARALGVDIDVLRFRRKVDFPVNDRTK